jgi:DNA polymerase-3 subunit epsilon
MDFVAIDVETANADMASICQIGVAGFTGDQLTEEWSTLVDPEDYFDGMNVSVHGIEPHMVEGQPRLPEVSDRLRTTLEGAICVCHTHFDRVALNKAFAKYDLKVLTTTWLDSARVVRRTWKDLSRTGYGLANVCRKIGYEFSHHDALEDAKAAGFVLLAAMRESQLGIDQWCQRVNLPVDLERWAEQASICRTGNPDGDLYGEVLVFTGALNMPRREAADFAASIGCEVAEGVTKRTTILVIGDQDVRKLAGHELSSKHRKAEQLAAGGQRIRLIRESDFQALVRTARSEAAAAEGL